MSSDRESWLYHPSREGFDSVFERMLGSAILQPILPVYLILGSMVHISCLVRTDFCSCVMANLGHAPAAKKKYVIKTLKV